jgi:hypothetical protein
LTISGDQFNHLDEYAALENLHVYGDLLKLYALPIHASIAEAGRLCDEIRILDAQILTLYVSYVLAKVGFYVQLFAGEDFAESGGRLYTTEFSDEDWLENLYLFRPMEDEPDIQWDYCYENSKGEVLKIIFATIFISEVNFRTGKTSNEAEHLAKSFDESASNYVIAHPRLSRQAKEAFMRVKKQMKTMKGEDLVLSTGEFIARFIPDEQKRYIIEQNWNSLRSKILERLQKEWPIIILARNDQQISDIRERLHKSMVKYENREFDDAIKDVGVSCESLLQVLYSVYGSTRSNEDLGFNDLLTGLKSFIEEEFGENIYNDLNFIRDWRNIVVHPKQIKPDIAIAFQVISKADLFFKLFEMKIIKQKRIDSFQKSPWRS